MSSTHALVYEQQWWLFRTSDDIITWKNKENNNKMIYVEKVKSNLLQPAEIGFIDKWILWY